MAVPEILTRELGPLPVWGWGVAIVGGVGIGIVLNRRRSSPTPVAPDTEATFMAPSLSAFPSPGAYGTGGAIGISTGVVPTEPSGPTISNNREWRAAALRSLVSQGMDSLAVDQALGRYLEGRSLTTAQQAIVAEALRRHGLPPDPAPVQPDAAPPADPNAPPPPDPNAIASDPDPRSRAIRHAFIDVLGRDPGPQPRGTYWWDQIESGAITGPSHLRNAIAATAEGSTIF